MIDRKGVVKAQLKVLNGTLKGDVFLVEEDALRIGRRSDNDIVLDDPTVSRYHAEVRVDKGCFVIERISKSALLKVDSKRCERSELSGVHKLRLGKTYIQFMMLEETQRSERGAIAFPIANVVSELRENDLYSVSGVNQKDLGRFKRVANPKLWLMFWMTVAFLFVALFQMRRASTLQHQQRLSEVEYINELNLAVTKFRSQSYGEVVESMSNLVKRYPQHHGARNMRDLGELWCKKGERYEDLDWRRAEDLSRELINSNPSADLVTSLGQDLMIWLSKEESNMMSIREGLASMERSSWGAAVDAFGAVAEDSCLHELYADQMQLALEGWIRRTEQQLDDRVLRHRWDEALEFLSLLLGKEERTVWVEQRDLYRDYSHFHEMLTEAEDAHQRGDFDLVEQLLQGHTEQSPYKRRVEELLLSSKVARLRRERSQCFYQGRAAQAIALSQQHFPEDTLFVQHVEAVNDLYRQAQAAAISEHPEQVVPLAEKIIGLESDEANHYVQQALGWRNQWSSPRQLADLFLNRANVAWQKRDLAEAIKWYQQAEDKGSPDAVERLKSMEKQAWVHYNRAMQFASQGDQANVGVYLSKAMDLLPEGHRLRDRIELYVRRELK